MADDSIAAGAGFGVGGDGYAATRRTASPLSIRIPLLEAPVAEHYLRQHVVVSEDDRTVAAAEVTISGGSGGTARASLRAESGHITPGRRASLVDAVLDLPGVRACARLQAVLPLGDCESLQRLREPPEPIGDTR